ncbi:MAG: DUF4355 domain-containing protein [Clostridia bacterium]|nr:DUF4355 domain-containing protein [Clostridia bacterium]
MEELMEQTAEQTAEQEEQTTQEEQAAHTLALERELDSLRQEKQHRQLTDEAAAMLRERGIDPCFAPFVLGDSAAATRRKVEQFDRQYAEALRRHLAARLPNAEPRDFSAVRPKPRRRGIRKV